MIGPVIFTPHEVIWNRAWLSAMMWCFAALVVCLRARWEDYKLAQVGRAAVEGPDWAATSGTVTGTGFAVLFILYRVVPLEEYIPGLSGPTLSENFSNDRSCPLMLSKGWPSR